MKFDRLVQFDEKSKAFPIRALITHVTPRSYTWKCALWLDQGNEGACVGFGWTQEAGARPVVVPNLTNEIAFEVYDLARQLDEFPGEDYEGSSVLGGAKAAKQKGWLKEYRWGFSELDLALAVGWHGPAVLGLNWREDMMEPDKNGLVTARGQVVGGHCILCNGVNIRTGLYRLHNSWGRGYGVNGECFISRSDMALLLADQGEACIPVVRTNPK